MTTQYIPEAMFANGFTDLVSVIPPGAQLTPSSKIPQAQIGKIPGRRVGNGLWAGYDWRKTNADLATVKSWAGHGANVGLRADAFPGVDIDCMDEGLAQIVQDVAFGQLGGAPIRVGRPPKRLLMYRAEEPFGRMRLWIEKYDGTSHLVEVLGMGQQYVIHGVHPTTMKPYAWDLTLSTLHASELRVITREMVDAFFTELAEQIDILGIGTIIREGDGRPITHSAGEQAALRAPSLDMLRECVRTIPNTNELFPDRTSYLKIGYAIRAAGDEDVDEAYSIFDEWAMKWEGNGRQKGNDPDVVLEDWRRMRGPYSVGWTFLAETARPYGFDTTSLDFEAEAKIEDEATDAPLFSDHWLADRVVARQKGVLKYVPQRGTYIVWDGARWQPDAELLADNLIKLELRAIAIGILRRGTNERERKESGVLANQICTSGKVPAVASLIKSDRAVAVSAHALDFDPWLLNTPAGIVDLRTGKITPPNPDALCTRITAVAPDFTADSPLWKTFLKQSTGGDAALQSYLQRLSGYCLTGIVKEHQLSFIFGPGGNGKSVFMNVLSGILGDYAVMASMETFTATFGTQHSTDIAMLAGSRLVTASETESGKRWNEPLLKKLTGGEEVTARFMRQNNFTFSPTFKLVFVGNHKPEIRTVDEAMRRRIQMIPFTVTPPRVDKELGDKLRAEWPAILAWMIEGCQMWQDLELNPPKVVRELTDEYFTDEDAHGRWIRECIEPHAEGADAGSSMTDLFGSWREWARAQGEEPGNVKRLSAALAARRYRRWQDPTSRRRGFLGIQVRNLDLEELGF